MNQSELLQFLEENNIRFELTSHPATFLMNEERDFTLPHPEADAKNLFVRDDKKRNYYLLTVRGNKRVNLKEFKQKYQTRSLSFTSASDLDKYLHLTPGSVTPFGLLNVDGYHVQFYLDEEFLKDEALIACHPMINTATVTLKTDDLIHLLEENGHSVNLIQF